jgi:hypothetical protein
MEDVSILTLSMFFIVIYIFCIFCIYIDFLLYVVLQLLCLSSRPSMPMDASMPSPTTDASIEASYSLGVPHTQLCFTFDKFTMSRLRECISLPCLSLQCATFSIVKECGKDREEEKEGR